MKKKIVLTGGGTAGHIYPALALIPKLKDYEIHYFGGNGMEKEILKNHKEIIYHEIPVVKLERKLTMKNLLIPFKLLKSICVTKKELKKISPNIIFSKGGFVSVPVVISAHKLHLPTISHESDLSLGLANKIILHYCDVMCTTFDKTCKVNKKCVHTGQPIREQVFKGKKLSLFQNNKPILLVLGGSLGAKFLNDLVSENICELTKNFNVIHITGKNNFRAVNFKDYINLDYAKNIEDYYETCDIVLSRAGSGVINELLKLKKPMLLIPLSKKCSRGDQIENAKYFQEKGFSIYLEEENANFNNVEEKLLYISKNKEKFIKNMQKNEKFDTNALIFDLITKYEIKN